MLQTASLLHVIIVIIILLFSSNGGAAVADGTTLWCNISKTDFRGGISFFTVNSSQTVMLSSNCLYTLRECNRRVHFSVETETGGAAAARVSNISIRVDGGSAVPTVELSGQHMWENMSIYICGVHVLHGASSGSREDEVDDDAAVVPIIHLSNGADEVFLTRCFIFVANSNITFNGKAEFSYNGVYTHTSRSSLFFGFQSPSLRLQHLHLSVENTSMMLANASMGTVLHPSSGGGEGGMLSDLSLRMEGCVITVALGGHAVRNVFSGGIGLFIVMGRSNGVAVRIANTTVDVLFHATTIVAEPIYSETEWAVVYLTLVNGNTANNVSLVASDHCVFRVRLGEGHSAAAALSIDASIFSIDIPTHEPVQLGGSVDNLNVFVSHCDVQMWVSSNAAVVLVRGSRLPTNASNMSITVRHVSFRATLTGILPPTVSERKADVVTIQDFRTLLTHLTVDVLDVDVQAGVEIGDKDHPHEPSAKDVFVTWHASAHIVQASSLRARNANVSCRRSSLVFYYADAPSAYLTPVAAFGDILFSTMEIVSIILSDLSNSRVLVVDTPLNASIRIAVRGVLLLQLLQVATLTLAGSLNTVVVLVRNASIVVPFLKIDSPLSKLNQTFISAVQSTMPASMQLFFDYSAGTTTEAPWAHSFVSIDGGSICVVVQDDAAASMVGNTLSVFIPPEAMANSTVSMTVDHLTLAAAACLPLATVVLGVSNVTLAGSSRIIVNGGGRLTHVFASLFWFTLRGASRLSIENFTATILGRTNNSGPRTVVSCQRVVFEGQSFVVFASSSLTPYPPDAHRLTHLVMFNTPLSIGTVGNDGAPVLWVSCGLWGGVETQCADFGIPTSLVAHVSATFGGATCNDRCEATSTHTLPLEDVAASLVSGRIQDVARTSSFVAGVGAGAAVLAAAGGTLAAFDAQALAGLGLSVCAPELASSTSTARFMVSPWYDLGAVAMIFGNAALIGAVWATHFCLVVIKRRQLARLAATNEASTALAHVSLTLPPTRTSYLRAASMALRFPHFSLIASMLLLPGIGFGSATLLLRGDAVSVVCSGCGIAILAGATWLRIRWIGGHHNALRMVFRAYQRRDLALARRRLGSVLSKVPSIAVPIGQWGPRKLTATHGRVRSTIRQGQEWMSEYAVTFSVSMNIIGGLSLPDAACGVVFGLASVIPLCGLVLMAWRQPCRVALTTWLCIAQYSLILATLLLTAVLRAGAIDREQGGAVLPIVALVLGVISVFNVVHSVVVLVWEGRVNGVPTVGEHPPRLSAPAPTALVVLPVDATARRDRHAPPARGAQSVPLAVPQPQLAYELHETLQMLIGMCCSAGGPAGRVVPERRVGLRL